MTDTRNKSKSFDFINALILPLILCVLVIVTQVVGKAILPAGIQATLIPTFPESVPAGLAYPELIGIYAICLIGMNNIRWPIQIVLYIILAAIASALSKMFSAAELLTPFSSTCAAWMGAALVASLWSKANPTFQTKQKALVAGAVLILFGLNIPLSQILFNHLAEDLTTSLPPSLIGITTGAVFTLALAGIINAIGNSSLEKAQSMQSLLFRTAGDEKLIEEEIPERPKKSASPLADLPMATEATEVSAKKKAQEAAKKKAKNTAQNAPSTATDKIILNTDVPEIEMPSRTPNSQARKGKPGRQSPDNKEDSDWLNKHLNALNK